jgi:hypothetical protein
MVEAGSILEMALLLHSPLPAGSYRLATLDTQSGVGLIERTFRCFVPTSKPTAARTSNHVQAYLATP